MNKRIDIKLVEVTPSSVPIDQCVMPWRREDAKEDSIVLTYHFETPIQKLVSIALTNNGTTFITIEVGDHNTKFWHTIVNKTQLMNVEPKKVRLPSEEQRKKLFNNFYKTLVYVQDQFQELNSLRITCERHCDYTKLQLGLSSIVVFGLVDPNLCSDIPKVVEEDKKWTCPIHKCTGAKRRRRIQKVLPGGSKEYVDSWSWVCVEPSCSECFVIQ